MFLTVQRKLTVLQRNAAASWPKSAWQTINFILFFFSLRTKISCARFGRTTRILILQRKNHANKCLIRSAWGDGRKHENFLTRMEDPVVVRRHKPVRRKLSRNEPSLRMSRKRKIIPPLYFFIFNIC